MLKAMQVKLIVAFAAGALSSGSLLGRMPSAESGQPPRGGAAAEQFRALAANQCEQAILANPSRPEGFDARGACRCAIDTAFGGQDDPVSYARSAAGQQALTRAIISCGQQQLAGPVPDEEEGPADGADAFRALAVTQCVEVVRAHPEAPKGFDATGTCQCAVDEAFGEAEDPVSYANSERGQQALTDAIVACGRRRLGQ
jgi:hypothetical protein